MSDEEDRLKAIAAAKEASERPPEDRDFGDIDNQSASAMQVQEPPGPFRPRVVDEERPETMDVRAANAARGWVEKNHPSWLATEDEAALNGARIQRYKNEAEMKALPTAMWMRHNVPGANWVAKNFEKSGEKARQPVSMQREFPKTPQGKADEEAYIQRVREIARKASAK